MFLPPVFVQQPVPQGDLFAVSFAAGHDLNDDRIPDLAIVDATPLDGVDVWFVSGRDGSVLARRESRSAPGWGSVEFLGDIDCDGYSEVAVAVTHYERPGRVEILSGRDASVMRTISGGELGVRLGWAVRAAGDVDGDGSPDLIVSGTQSIDASHTQTCVFVVSGGSGSVVWSVTDEPARERPLASFAGIGDVDGDGRDDVAVGWRSNDPRVRRVILYSGRTGLPLREIPGEKAESDFGHSLDGGVDFDGDLRPDILVGSPEFGCPSRTSARVRVYSGCDGSLLRMLDGINFPRVDFCESDQFGECARFVRDTNGDGIPEILVGSPEEGLFEGSAYLCSGRTGSILYAIEGKFACTSGAQCDQDDYHTGRAVAAGGDIDLDGVEDFVVGNEPYDRGQWGRVRAYSGRTGKLLLVLDRERLLQAEPPAPSTPR